MRNFKSIVISIALVTLFFRTNGQADDCTSTLHKARELYRQGIIEEIAVLLKPCIENGFTRNERNEAYKLIVLASLIDGNQQQAENTMIEFLKKNPEYEVLPTDPLEFVYLFESYHTLSVFSIGLKFGPNAAEPWILEPYSMGDLSTTELSNKPGAGYQVGFSVNRYLARRLFVNVEFNYIVNSYKFVEGYKKITGSEEPVFDKVTFTESLSRFDIPVSFGYEIGSGPINYFVRAGASYGRLLRINGTPEGIRDFDGSTQIGAKQSMDAYRYKSQYFCHAGIGLKYKVPRGYLVADLRYHLGLKNFVLPDTRYKVGEILDGYYHIDDDYRVNSLTLSFGYYFSFYQPRKAFN